MRLEKIERKRSYNDVIRYSFFFFSKQILN